MSCIDIEEPIFYNGSRFTMIIEETAIAGVYVFTPKVFGDFRGYFTDIFNQTELDKKNLHFDIAQISHAFNPKRGTLRGMHYQGEPYSQKKIVTCLKGSIYDIAVDVRDNSPTYGKSVGVELTEENKKLLYIPVGFAHGLQTLTDNVLMQYFISNKYSPEHERGLRWNDPFLNIHWPIDDPIVNERDSNWPLIGR